VLGAEVLSTDLSDGQMAATLNGQDITVTISNGNVFINNAQVTVADIPADNGVVHVIDAVLLPELSSTFDTNGDFARFNVFPNPAANQFSVSLDEFKNTESTIHILSLDGRIVKTVRNNQILQPINISELSNEVYLVQFITNGESFVKKLVVQN